ncbi:MAG: ATP-binding protein [Patescibacteria group bacterium]
MESEKLLSEVLVKMIELASPEKKYTQKLQDIVELCARSYNISRVCIIIRNLRGELVVKAGYPISGHGIGLRIMEEYGERFLRNLMRNRKIEWINDPGSNPRTPHMKSIAQTYCITSIACFPLYYKDDNFGIMVFDFTDGHTISKKDFVEIVKKIAKQTAFIIRNEYGRRKNISEAIGREEKRILAENSDRIAHIIRNKMMSINLAAKRLKNQIPGSDYLRIIIEEGSVVEKTVNEVIRFTRPEKIQTDYYNLNIFLKFAVKDLIEKENLSFRKVVFELDQRLYRKNVPFDREKMSQCVHDLIINASQAEAQNILIKTKLNSKKGTADIYLSNDGETIDPQMAEEMFNPFASTRADGTGLGLALVKRILQDHCGDVSCISQKENNHLKSPKTLFKLTLPLKRQSPCL